MKKSHPLSALRFYISAQKEKNIHIETFSTIFLYYIANILHITGHFEKNVILMS